MAVGEKAAIVALAPPPQTLVCRQPRFEKPEACRRV